MKKLWNKWQAIPGDARFAVINAIICATIAALVMCSCTIGKSIVPPALTAPISESREESLSMKAHRLEGELAAVNADLRYQQDQTVRWISNLSAGVCALGCIVCFIASIFLPVMKTRLLVGGVAFAAGIAVSLTVRQAIPYLPWIGLAIVAVGVGATLPTFIKLANTAGGKS